MFSPNETKEHIDTNVCFDLPSHLNINDAISDASLNRHFSNDQQIQQILKMYKEELQSCSTDRRKITFSHAKNECNINNNENANIHAYLNNMSPVSNYIESVNINNLHINDSYNNYVKPKQEPFSNEKITIPSYDTNTIKSKTKHNTNYIKHSDIINAESFITLKNASVNGDIEKNIEPSLALEDSNTFKCYNIETKSINYDNLEEKAENLENGSFARQSFISYDPTISKNTGCDRNNPNTETNTPHNNILSSYKCSPFSVLSNCCHPYNYLTSDIQDEGNLNDSQLNYSASSSCDLICKNYIDISNKSSIQELPVPSIENINEPVNADECSKKNSLSEMLNESFSDSFFNQPIQLGSAYLKQNKNCIESTLQNADLSLNDIFYKEFLEKAQNEKKKKDATSTFDAINPISNTIETNVKCISSDSFKKNKKKNTSTEDRKPKTYSLADIRSGKVKMPNTIFKPLPMNSVENNIIDTYSRNKKMQKFMNDCNDSVNLIMKYPRIEKKQGNTLFMPTSFTQTMTDNIGLPIVYEDDFDRKNHHPNVVNLHMGSVFEKHVFNILKNKKELGKKIFTENKKFDKYNYENGNGFWISNIDKERLVNPEQNPSYITELVYEKENSYEQEMEILRECKNYDSTVPPVQDLYKKNNFCKFLCDQKMYKPNLKPDIATIMRRYDIQEISDHKICHTALGITPVYDNGANRQ